MWVCAGDGWVMDGEGGGRRRAGIEEQQIGTKVSVVKIVHVTPA